MLVVNPDKRLSAREVLSHPWMRGPMTSIPAPVIPAALLSASRSNSVSGATGGGTGGDPLKDKRPTALTLVDEEEDDNENNNNNENDV
jgi:hypothetical protein